MAVDGDVFGSKRTSILLLAIWLNILCEADGPDFLRQLFVEENYGIVTFGFFVRLVASHIDNFVEAEQKKSAAISIVLAVDRLLTNNYFKSFKHCLPDVICTCLQVGRDLPTSF